MKEEYIEKKPTAEEAYEKMKKVFKEVPEKEKPEIDYDMGLPKKLSVKHSDTTASMYKYNEGEFITELKEHVDATYSSHYSGGVQTTEFIMANSESLDFLKGNVIKYIQRYGKKDGTNVKDLYKACHYIMMMQHYAEKKNG